MRSARSALGILATAGALTIALTGAAALPDDKDCRDFTSQAKAQTAFEEAGDGDPYGLDANGNGMACESFFFDGTGGDGIDEIDETENGGTGDTGGDATENGGAPTSFGEGQYQVGVQIAAGRYRTDGPADGEVCYWYRQSADSGGSKAIIEFGGGAGPRSVSVLATDAFVEFTGPCTWTAAATDEDDDSDSDPGGDAPADDRDCADFTTQAEAQAALDADTTDPDRLDEDDDGVACEEQFATEDQQVSVVPNGGVATGGLSTS